jgi:hypothetical protein
VRLLHATTGLSFQPSAALLTADEIELVARAPSPSASGRSA